MWVSVDVSEVGKAIGGARICMDVLDLVSVCGVGVGTVGVRFGDMDVSDPPRPHHFHAPIIFI